MFRFCRLWWAPDTSSWHGLQQKQFFFFSILAHVLDVRCPFFHEFWPRVLIRFPSFLSVEIFKFPSMSVSASFGQELHIPAHEYRYIKVRFSPQARNIERFDDFYPGSAWKITNVFSHFLFKEFHEMHNTTKRIVIFSACYVGGEAFSGLDVLCLPMSSLGGSMDFS